jgi:hypothetical protein
VNEGKSTSRMVAGLKILSSDIMASQNVIFLTLRYGGIVESRMGAVT